MFLQMPVEGLNPGLEGLSGDGRQLCAGVADSNIDETNASCFLHAPIILHTSQHPFHILNSGSVAFVLCARQMPLTQPQPESPVRPPRAVLHTGMTSPCDEQSQQHQDAVISLGWQIIQIASTIANAL